MEVPSKSKLLQELHEDEQKLLVDERRLNTTIIFLMFFVVIFTGVTFYFAHTVRTLESQQTKQPSVNSMQPIATLAPVETLPTTHASPAPTSSSVKIVKTASSKTSYINLGFGTNQSSEWADVFGATTTADIGDYTHIKDVHFEAFIKVPTANGNVSVRLYNKTDNHPVWNSEVSKEGTAETIQFTSPSVNYDSGPKLYQVQMKSQLNVVATLVQARLAIQTE